MKTLWAAFLITNTQSHRILELEENSMITYSSPLILQERNSEPFRVISLSRQYWDWILGFLSSNPFIFPLFLPVLPQPVYSPFICGITQFQESLEPHKYLDANLQSLELPPPTSRLTFHIPIRKIIQNSLLRIQDDKRWDLTNSKTRIIPTFKPGLCSET